MTYVGRRTIGYGVVKVNCTKVAIRWINGYRTIWVERYSTDFIAVLIFDCYWCTHSHWDAVDFGNA